MNSSGELIAGRITAGTTSARLLCLTDLLATFAADFLREEGLQATYHVLPAGRTVGEFLNLPPELMLFSGMALGYRDESAPINTLRTDRAPLEAFARFHGC